MTILDDYPNYVVKYPTNILNIKSGNLIFNLFFNCRETVIDLFNGDVWVFDGYNIKYRNKNIISIPLDDFGNAVDDNPLIVYYDYTSDDLNQREIREQILIKIRNRFPTYDVRRIAVCRSSQFRGLIL